MIPSTILRFLPFSDEKIMEMQEKRNALNKSFDEDIDHKHDYVTSEIQFHIRIFGLRTPWRYKRPFIDIEVSRGLTCMSCGSPKWLSKWIHLHIARRIKESVMQPESE